MATQTTTDQPATQTIERPAATVDDDAQVVATTDRLNELKAERAEIDRELMQLRDTPRGEVTLGRSNPSERQVRIHQAILEAQQRRDRAEARARELDRAIERAERDRREAVAMAEQRLADQRRGWAARYADRLADDPALRATVARLAEARKALASRRTQHSEATSRLERLRASRDPDDVDQIAEAEDEVTRTRRHVELVTETVEELEQERHEAAREAAARIGRQVAERQHTLREQLAEAFDRIDGLLVEDEQLRDSVAEDVGERANQTVGSRSGSAGLTPLLDPYHRDQLERAMGRIRNGLPRR